MYYFLVKLYKNILMEKFCFSIQKKILFRLIRSIVIRSGLKNSRHNCINWSTYNTRWDEECHTERPQKSNVCGSNFGRDVILTFFIDIHVQYYLELLQQQVILSLKTFDFNKIQYTMFTR